MKNSSPSVIDSVVTFVTTISHDTATYNEALNYVYGWEDNALIASKISYTATGILHKNYWQSEVFKPDSYVMTVFLYLHNDTKHYLAKATSKFILTGNARI